MRPTLRLPMAKSNAPVAPVLTTTNQEIGFMGCSRSASQVCRGLCARARSEVESYWKKGSYLSRLLAAAQLFLFLVEKKCIFRTTALETGITTTGDP